jgi:glycosyltransferase involved in cell wall biosynthesis
MKIGVVIPCYNVAKHIEDVVISTIPHCDFIVCVNDVSADNTKEVLHALADKHPNKVYAVSRTINGGVGAAMKTGWEEAVKLGADIIVKLDGDGQMDATYIPRLVAPLMNGQYDFAKGNRFHDFQALRNMPFIRRVGNLGMSFMIKAASGYWNIFDPTNGFFAVSASMVTKLAMRKIAARYFFESSLLIELYYHGAKIADVPMPAIYGDERSNLSVKKVLLEFPPKILKAFLRRIVLRYYIYDVNIGSFYLLFGTLLFGWGLVYAFVQWLHYRSLHLAAPTGTVMLPTLAIVLGFQLLLSAINFDIENGKLPRQV